MDLQLHGKVAIVTGSSRGLGLASAKALVARRLFSLRSAPGARRRCTVAAAALRAAARTGGLAGDRVLPVVADVSTVEGVEQVVSRAVEAFGGLDILVNNVGLARGSTIVETSDAEWQEAFDQTLVPAIHASRLAVSPYETPRRRFDRHDRLDLGPRVGRANDVQRRQGCRDQPGEVDGAAAGARQHSREQRRARVDPLSRGILAPPSAGRSRRHCRFRGAGAAVRAFRPPEEVGAVVAFLSSPSASWISGASVPVDGCQGRSNI